MISEPPYIYYLYSFKELTRPGIARLLRIGMKLRKVGILYKHGYRPMAYEHTITQEENHQDKHK